MKEVAGAVVAISIVLVAVFVPVAFFPGTTGAIYRQFALTIAASVALSTFCALTLTPGAERAAAARTTHGKKWIVFREIDRALDWTRARLRPRRCAGCCGTRCWCSLAFLRLRRRHGAAVPRGAHRLHPRRGSGLPHHHRAGPRGHVARADREGAAAGRAGAARSSPRCAAMFAVGGFSFAGTGPELRAPSSSTLKPWDERPSRSSRWPALVRAAARAARRASAARGCCRSSRRPSAAWARGRLPVHRRGHRGRPLAGRAGGGRPGAGRAGPTRTPRLRGVFTLVHRRHAAARRGGRPRRRPRRSACRSIRSSARCSSSWAASTSTTSTTPTAPTASTCRPSSSSATARRTSAPSTCAATAGTMIPLESLVKVTPDDRPRRSSATTTSSARRRSTARPRRACRSGEALEAMEALAAQTLPEGMSSEWTGHQPRAEAERRPDAHHLRAWASSSCSWCWRRSTRASRCRS